MDNDATFDHLAFTMRKLAWTQCSLEDLAEKADVNLMGMSAIALRNAMLMRGYRIHEGLVTLYDGHKFKATVAVSFKKFVKRAAEIIDAAGAPIMPADLVGMVGLVEAAIPVAQMTFHLNKVGIWLIPGVGYWHKRHYVDQRGILYGSVTTSEQARRVNEAFQEYGWPMTAYDLEAATHGKVSSRYFQDEVKRPWPEVISVGWGLYVPAGAARRVGFPMSKNIAQAFLDLGVDEVVDSKDNTRMYRMCSLLQRAGYGVSRTSNTVRNGSQRRIRYFKLNQTGRKALTSLLDNRKRKDEY